MASLVHEQATSLGNRRPDLSDRHAVENCAVLPDLDAEIVQAEERLAKLDRLHADATARLTELNRLRSTRRLQKPRRASDLHSPASKLKLFGELFIGRSDVFAVRWENRARGRSGYAPRCANEWRHGICGKPKGPLRILHQPSVPRPG